MSRLTDSLLGLSEGTARAPNTYSLGRYLGILFIILLGTVYALPNLYPPDFALQIRAEAADAQMSQDIVDRATKALDAVTPLTVWPFMIGPTQSFHRPLPSLAPPW